MSEFNWDLCHIKARDLEDGSKLKLILYNFPKGKEILKYNNEKGRTTQYVLFFARITNNFVNGSLKIEKDTEFEISLPLISLYNAWVKQPRSVNVTAGTKTIYLELEKVNNKCYEIHNVKEVK